MNFLTMQQELGDRLKFDPTNSADATKLKRWLNMAQSYICGKNLWPFMLAEEIVQTVVDITTGTVSVSAAGTALTFSSAPSTSVQDSYIKLVTSNDWYKITSHTAASVSATIFPAYVGTSALTGGTFRIRKLTYKTTTPLVQILDMKQLVTPVRLLSLSPRGTDFFLPLYYDDGMPYYYTMSSPDSAGTPQFSFMLSPNSVMNIMVRGIKSLTDLSADAEITEIPVQWQDAMINIAAFYGFQALDDTRAASEFQAGEARIMDMARVLTHDLGRHRVMAAVNADLNWGLSWTLPSTFGPDVQ